MNISAMTVAAVMAVTATSPAFGQTFTYESTGQPPVTVGGTGPDGSPIGGSWLTGTGTTTWSGGAKSNYDFKCVAMTQPPRDSIFNTHMVCDVTSADGNFTATFGCNPVNKEATKMSCVAGMVGKTGRFAGKRGTATNYQDGTKSGGTGQWNP